MKTLRIAAVCGMAGALALFSLSARGADETNPNRPRHRSSSEFNTSTQGQTNQTWSNIERANKLLGKEVLSSDNQKLGKLDNIIVDLQSGRILYAVVGSGGFLGAGEKKFAVPPGIFVSSTGDDLKLNVDKAKFAGAPEFSKDIDKDTELGQTALVNQVHKYFDQPAWWQGANTGPAEGQFGNTHKVNDVIGMKVKNVSDADMGKVDNVMLNLPQGRIVYVILSPASSLDLGNNLYALPPDALTLSNDRKTLTSDISKEKLASAPHFAKDNWAMLSNPSWASQVYRYYGKQAWFNTSNGALQPTGREAQSPKDQPLKDESNQK